MAEPTWTPPAAPPAVTDLDVTFGFTEHLPPWAAIPEEFVSWDPKHEHKMAGAAYLASLWFDDPAVPPSSSREVVFESPPCRLSSKASR